MAVTFIFQFPIALYSGCLIGLQHQVGLNIINIVFAIFRYAGAAAVLILSKGNLIFFFWWQVAVTLVNVFVVRFYLWIFISTEVKVNFDMSEIKSVGGFALAMSGINILGLAINQVDKLIVSKLFSLEAFGYYTLAWTAASMVNRIAIPVFNAVYPKLTQLYAQKNETLIKEFYQKSSQTMAVFVIPISIFLTIFSKDILLLWLRNPDIVERVNHHAIQFFVAGMFAALFLMPYCMRLASGKTGIIVKANIILLACLIPAVIYFTNQFAQPALAWLLLNIAVLFFLNYFYLKDVLQKVLLEWFEYSVFLPIIFCSVFFLSCKFGLEQLHIDTNALKLILITFVGLLGFIGTGLLLPKTRQILLRMIP
jgi:O-antigen/teichoic acid export membrane protein